MIAKYVGCVALDADVGVERLVARAGRRGAAVEGEGQVLQRRLRERGLDGEVLLRQPAADAEGDLVDLQLAVGLVDAELDAVLGAAEVGPCGRGGGRC
jgi:hypothetical protein